IHIPPKTTNFPYTTLFRSKSKRQKEALIQEFTDRFGKLNEEILLYIEERYLQTLLKKFKIKNVMETNNLVMIIIPKKVSNELDRSEEHTSELQSRENLVCR